MNLGSLNLIDLLLMGLFAAAMVIGYIQGLLRQVIGLAVLYVAAILGAQYFPTVSNWLVVVFRLTSPTRFVNAAAFFLIVIAVVLLLNTLAYDAYRATKLQLFPLVDHLGGSLLGLVTVIIAISLILPVVNFALVEPWTGSESIRLTIRDGVETARLVPFFDLIKPVLLSTLGPWLPAGMPAIFDL